MAYKTMRWVARYQIVEKSDRENGLQQSDHLYRDLCAWIPKYCTISMIQCNKQEKAAILAHNTLSETAIYPSMRY